MHRMSSQMLQAFIFFFIVLFLAAWRGLFSSDLSGHWIDFNHFKHTTLTVRFRKANTQSNKLSLKKNWANARFFNLDSCQTVVNVCNNLKVLVILSKFTYYYFNLISDKNTLYWAHSKIRSSLQNPFYCLNTAADSMNNQISQRVSMALQLALMISNKVKWAQLRPWGFLRFCTCPCEDNRTVVVRRCYLRQVDSENNTII